MTTTAAEDLAGILLMKGRTMSVAESCTGGMIGSRITAVPGSSSYFLGGVISYSNDSKERLLGVSRATLEEHGAVSPQTAAEMAAGVRSLLGSDVSVAVTGIAGPDGGTAGKPVGLVYIAVCGDGMDGVRGFRMDGDRTAVRSSAAEAALRMLSDGVRSLP